MSHKAKPRHLLLKTMGVTTQNYGTYTSKPWGFYFPFVARQKNSAQQLATMFNNHRKISFSTTKFTSRGNFIWITRKFHLDLDVILPHYSAPKITPGYKCRHGIPSWHLYPGVNNPHSRESPTTPLLLPRCSRQALPPFDVHIWGKCAMWITNATAFRTIHPCINGRSMRFQKKNSFVIISKKVVPL